ncbi:MAG: hypothetical protein Q7R81_02515 [Candidatus Peregrinibacteria bacterium]|nr:hypothetical protein [Candidatus Peregrinibacteria bacterium]
MSHDSTNDGDLPEKNRKPKDSQEFLETWLSSSKARISSEFKASVTALFARMLLLPDDPPPIDAIAAELLRADIRGEATGIEILLLKYPSWREARVRLAREQLGLEEPPPIDAEEKRWLREAISANPDCQTPEHERLSLLIAAFPSWAEAYSKLDDEMIRLRSYGRGN